MHHGSSNAIRFYGYTGGPAVDVLLGLLIGLIMFVLMDTERIAEKYKEYFMGIMRNRIVIVPEHEDRSWPDESLCLAENYRCDDGIPSGCLICGGNYPDCYKYCVINYDRPFEPTLSVKA